MGWTYSATVLSPHTTGYGTQAATSNRAIREDLIDVLTIIDPAETPLLQMIATGTASFHEHSWIETDLPTISASAVAMGAAFSAVTRPTPSRKFNYCQIFRDDISIADSLLSYDIAGIGDAVRNEVEGGMLNMRRSMESRVFEVGAGKDPVSTATTGGLMGSLAYYITTNAKSVTDTTIGGGGGAGQTQMTEAVFNGILRLAFQNGGYPKDAFVNGYGIEDIADFSAQTGHNRVISALDKTLARSVTTYMSNFGDIRIHLDRWVPDGTATATGTTGDTDASGHAFFLTLKNLKLCFLRGREPEMVPQGKDGDKTDIMLRTEATLELRGEKSHARLYDIWAA